MKSGFGLLDGGLKEVVPAGLAEFVQAAAAEVVLVGHALLAPGMVAQFEAGAEVAVGEQRRAQAGAEREHQFDAVALDGSIAGHIGVVAHADGLLPALFQLGLEREAPRPEGMEVEAADRCLPCLTTPGKPTETRSKSPISLRNSSRPTSTASGVGTAG